MAENCQIWERLYRERPSSFRHYPNEELIRFLGRQFSVGLPEAERHKLRALEVGCGNGANLWAVAKEGFQAYGLDRAESSLALAHVTLKRWDVQARLSMGDLLGLPYRSGSFDIVIDVVTLQHIPYGAHRQAYAEIARVLRNGGWFFSVHLGSRTWDYRHGGGKRTDRHTFDNVVDPEAIFPGIGTVCMLPAEEDEGLLEAAGLRCVSLETVTKTYGNRQKQCQYVVVTCAKP